MKIIPPMHGGTVEAHCAWGDASGWRPRTTQQRRYQLQALARWLGRDPLTATTPELARWLADGCQLSTTARGTYLATLRTYYRWAVLHQLRADDPSTLLHTPRPPRRLPRPAPPEAIREGIEAASGDLRTWLMLAYYAGLRCCEIADLRGEDITGDTIFVRDGKGGRQGMLPAHPALRMALGHYPARGELWPDTYKQVSRKIADHFRGIGWEGVTAHRLRHSFGTNIYKASGRDLRMTQELLRHASPATTAIYTLVDVEESAGVVGQLAV